MSGPRIDLRKIAGVDQTTMQQRVRRLALLLLRDWQVEARKELGGTSVSAKYRNAITMRETGEASAEVQLVGTLPNMFEQGMGPGGVGTTGSYDAKQFVLKEGTRNLRRTKDGRLYVNIPFRHAASTIPVEALEALKGLEPSLTAWEKWRPPNSNLVDPNAKQTKTKWGGRLGAEHGEVLRGAVRMQKEYSEASRQRGGEDVYMTWRRMIQGGKPWVHPGIEPRHLAVRVVQRSGDIMREVF